MKELKENKAVKTAMEGMQGINSIFFGTDTEGNEIVGTLKGGGVINELNDADPIVNDLTNSCIVYKDFVRNVASTLGNPILNGFKNNIKLIENANVI